MAEDKDEDLASLLRTLPSGDLFSQYIDLMTRPLPEISIPDGEPPTYCAAAFDAFRAYERIGNYLFWTGVLNEQRKSIGKRIQDFLDTGDDHEAGWHSGLQEVAYHLMSVTADAVAKQFKVLVQRVDVDIDLAITNDIGMYGTIRNDFEQPDDDRGLSQRYGEKLYHVERDADGSTMRFHWRHEPGDKIGSRKGPVSFSDDGIELHRARVEEGLNVLREQCISRLVQKTATSGQEDVVRWMLQRRITISVGTNKSR